MIICGIILKYDEEINLFENGTKVFLKVENVQTVGFKKIYAA